MSDEPQPAPGDTYQELSERAESAPDSSDHISITPTPPNCHEPVTPFGYPTTPEAGHR